MNLNKKIRKEEKHLKRYRKVKKIGLVILIIGLIYILIASFFNIRNLMDIIDNSSQSKITIDIIYFIIKTILSFRIFRIGLCLFIMFGRFANKKKINIEKYKKELNNDFIESN